MLNLFRKLFLVKEIKSKIGELHFQRYRLLECKLGAIYIHYIAKSDEDSHQHSHPFNFYSLILKGGYDEDLTYFRSLEQESFSKRFLSIGYRFFNDYHKIKLIAPTWTLVFASPRNEDYVWGYLVDGRHIEFEKYREMKNKEELLDKRIKMD